MGIFKTEGTRYQEGKIKDRWIALVAIGIIAIAVYSLVAIPNIVFLEGVETTVTGTVQLHRLRYDRLFDYEYTDMELRTYSGDTHHVTLFGHHPEIEFQKTYRITFVIRDHWAHWKLVNEALIIEEL
ncbi:MAG: hypothetical protein ACYTFW_01115 [Planctomycetota bacterium]|jgi:hypothetical protein